MFWQLFCKELKYYFKSITYFIFALGVIVFCFSQVKPSINVDDIKPKSPQEIDEIISKLPEQDRMQAKFGFERNYGRKTITDIKMKQKVVCNYLEQELSEGKIGTYKLGLLKKIKTSEKQENDLRDEIKKISPEKEISETDFINVLDEIDKIIGGGSNYGEKFRDALFQTGASYEVALEEYNAIVKEDKITNAYAREFADYMGITAGIFPIFIAAFVLIKDMKSRTQEIIFTKKVSSLKYILTKYLATIVAFIIPYFILATYETVIFSKVGAELNVAIDYFAFYKYVLTWILPTLMFVTALGMILAVVVKNPIPAIIIQILLWIVSITELRGSYGIQKILIRYNEITSNAEYIKYINNIAINRVFYFVLSIGILMLTIYIYNRRRCSVGEKLNLL
ncbi:ABC-2 family transporter protein [Clostridium cavendishii DSM 21758]|uniref:ABC-2 family transporter protein n=1 Tax=Clostridium cavendishii DSM 21758 TaxID=1121302 RepID=A0A1M6SIJ8_9CLOT|nr:ABC transporter permease subunit [Clostridium cavendishii]SHK44398.1 ABC-2 family transporter protein [Clostridium cavendishii DSM 21758]